MTDTDTSLKLERSAEDLLRLEVVAGPPMAPIELRAGSPTVLGRSESSDVPLPDGGVSRKHASIEFMGGEWIVTDLESRHGTIINGVQLDGFEAAPLSADDIIGIGPWSFRVSTGEQAAPSRMSTMVGEDHGRVEQVREIETDSLAQHRLGLLMECASSIQAARDELELADSLLDAAVAGTGFSNAALLRTFVDGEEIEVLGYRGGEDSTGDEMNFSRSLLRAASRGELVRLTDESPVNPTHSIASLGIHSAMCCPIYLGGSISALLYLDSRGSAGGGRSDAAAFCQAIAKMAGLALSNIKRSDLERRQRQLVADINSAREAQRQIMPANTDDLCGVRYAEHMIPGRFVAGDLFDAFAIPDGKVAMFLGDVAAKGVGAGILMATTQAHLNASLTLHGDLERAVNDVNHYLATHSAGDKFVSLWVGVIDPQKHELMFVDAGHGLWALCPGSGSAHKPEYEGDLVLGVDRDYKYSADHLTLSLDDRVVLFSDGIVEQPNPNGEQFGSQRALDLLDRSTSVKDDVDVLFDAIREFAATDQYADDTTVASFRMIEGFV